MSQRDDSPKTDLGPRTPQILEVETPHGLARVFLHEPERERALLVLGHGAGGGLAAPDLRAATRAALMEQVAVALVEQPYRRAGRRFPAPAPQLDAAWLTVVGRLASGSRRTRPLYTGGRSSGARVACRTASAAGAAGVVCLAFPLQPPPRRSGSAPASRLPELDAVEVPVLVVQGRRDPFGMPPARRGRRQVVRVDADHSLRAGSAVEAAVRRWLGARV